MHRDPSHNFKCLFALQSISGLANLTHSHIGKTSSLPIVTEITNLNYGNSRKHATTQRNKQLSVDIVLHNFNDNRKYISVDIVLRSFNDNHKYISVDIVLPVIMSQL